MSRSNPYPPTQAEIKKLLDEKLMVLKAKDVQCYNMDWYVYHKVDWNTADSHRVDTVITEPPRTARQSYLGPLVPSKSVDDCLSDKQVEEIPRSLKRFLRPGGYVVLLIDLDTFLQLTEVFIKEGYQVMQYLYVYGVDSQTIQNRNLFR